MEPARLPRRDVALALDPYLCRSTAARQGPRKGSLPVTQPSACCTAMAVVRVAVRRGCAATTTEDCVLLGRALGAGQKGCAVALGEDC